MNIKSVEGIRDEFFDNDKLSPRSIHDLKWHLENDPSPHKAIMLITDARIQELIPLVARYLDHEDDFVREIAVGCVLGRLRLAEYALKGFQMGLEDPYDNVRDLAIFNIGAVLNKIEDKSLQHKIADYLYHRLFDVKQGKSFKGAAYKSILTAMEVPIPEQPRVRDLENEINFDLVEKFKNKYGV
jgi:hypothetical protein